MLIIELLIFVFLLAAAASYWFILSGHSWHSWSNFLLIGSFILVAIHGLLQISIYSWEAAKNFIWIDLLVLVLLACFFFFLSPKLKTVLGIVVPIFLLFLFFLERFIKVNSAISLPPLVDSSARNLLIAHVALMIASYLSLASSFVFSLLFKYTDFKIKSGQFSAQKLDIGSLLILNYRFLLASFAFLGLGVLVGIYFAEVSADFNGSSLYRILLPFILWLLQAATISYSYISGIRGRLIANLTVVIFCFALLTMANEFYQLLFRLP